MAIESDLQSINPEEGVFLFVISPESYRPSHFLIFKYFAERLKDRCIYVSLNEPCSALNRELKKEGINTDKVYIIDGISRSQNQGGSIKNCTFLENPGSLTEVSIAITEAMNTGNYNFVFLDSVSTMLIYNNRETIENFLQFIIGKIKNMGISGAIIILNEGRSKELVGTVSQFFDNVIRS